MATTEPCNDAHPSVEVLELSEAQLAEAYHFVTKLASEISDGKLTHRDKWLSVKVKNQELTLFCGGKSKPCLIPSNHRFRTVKGMCIRACPKLDMLFEYVKRKEDEKKPSSRPVKETLKVGRYLYKLQQNQGRSFYWYLQYTENGKSTQVYLGKERPSFQPEVDLAFARNKQNKATVLAATVGARG